MHSSTAAITAFESLPVLDGKQLLKVLLRSVPSAQHRSDLGLAQIDEDKIDQLLAHPPSREGSPSWCGTQNTVSHPAESAPTPVGMLKKIGELFGMLVGGTVTVEEENTQLDVKLELDDAHFQHTEASSRTSASLNHGYTDEDDEMEVEYMIVADKCIAAAPSVEGTRDRLLEQQRRNKRRVGEVSSRFLTAPPVIKRRRQVTRLYKPRRKLKGVPGFR